MEIIRKYMAGYTTGFAAYVALQSALMRRFVARGGSPEEFCARLAPAFHRRFAPALLESRDARERPLLPPSPRLVQEQPMRAA